MLHRTISICVLHFQSGLKKKKKKKGGPSEIGLKIRIKLTRYFMLSIGIIRNNMTRRSFSKNVDISIYS